MCFGNFLFVFTQNHTKNPVHRLLGPREQQWPGCLWEPHVQHQHQGRGGEGRSLRSQPKHCLHHGLKIDHPHWKPNDSDIWRDHTLKEAVEAERFDSTESATRSSSSINRGPWVPVQKTRSSRAVQESVHWKKTNKLNCSVWFSQSFSVNKWDSREQFPTNRNKEMSPPFREWKQRRDWCNLRLAFAPLWPQALDWMGWNFAPDKTESKLKLSYLCQVIGMAWPSCLVRRHVTVFQCQILKKIFPIAPPQGFGVEYGVCVTNVTCLERTGAHYGCSARGSTRRRWTALQKFIGFISAVSSRWQQILPLHGRKRTADGDVWHEKVVTKHSVRHKNSFSERGLGSVAESVNSKPSVERKMRRAYSGKQQPDRTTSCLMTSWGRYYSPFFMKCTPKKG